MKKKLCVIGHFSFNKELLNGQTIKTKIVSAELEKQFGNNDILKIDTCGGKKALIPTIFKTIRSMFCCKNVLMLPAQNGLRIFAPLLSFFKNLSNTKLHYVVIGGWLPDFIENKPLLTRCLKDFDWIYVETNKMKRSLEKKGFDNVVVMPNCKELKILSNDELVYSTTEPLKLCTFSRVMKEKGIETAVQAVETVNAKLGKTAFSLDIYGQIDENQKDWFDNLSKTFPDYIRYGGLVSYNKSVEVLKNYFALLFPTYYDGEGFAGTIIDAYAAGVPVLASDWKYNAEIVNENTGYIYSTRDSSTLAEILKKVSANPTVLLSKKVSCLKESRKYKIDVVTKILIDKIKDE